MQKEGGFTIIELIVVIAIIAVLAAIVMVNVTSFIAKGKDSSIRGNLSTALTNAVVYFEANTNYTTLCTASSSFRNAYNAAGAISASETCAVNSTATGWCACAQLVSDTTRIFCVDYTGTKRETGGSVACTTECAAADVLCDGV